MHKDVNTANEGNSTAENTSTSIEEKIGLDITADSRNKFNWEMTELLNHINVGFYSRDIIADKYIRLSEGCPKIYGYDLQDFYDNSNLWYEVILKEDLQIVANQSVVLGNGGKSIAEYRIFHKDGRIRWLEVKAIPILSDDKLIRVDGIVSDITERKNFEFEILEANKLSQIIMDSLPGVFYMYNENGRFKYWNKNLTKVTGYSDYEFKSLSPLDLFDEHDKPLLSESISNVFKNGQGEVEAFLLTKDGNKIPYYFNGLKVIIKDEICLVGVGIDVSQSRKRKEELRKSQEMLTHVLNSIPQAIFWKDLNSVYLGCNTVFAKAAGVSDPVHVIGKTELELLQVPEQAEQFIREDREVMTSQKPRLHYIQKFKIADGSFRWQDLIKIPLKNHNNEVDGILGIFEDITDRKLEEEKQEKINEDLIQKNIGLKQFSYIVSHNLRSPISKILGLASLLEEENDNTVNKELLGYIANEALNLDKIVKDLNTIVSAQNLGNKVIEDVYFNDELRLIEQSIAHEISGSEATIETDFNEVGSLKTVRAYFYSILYNLLSNAIKYRDPQRHLVIKITTMKEDQYICMIVQDNGLGIDLSKHGSKVFGLYNRFHVGVVPGKGIGLNLVKTQAETLGGKVELTSKPGEGCTFKVYFVKG